MSKINIKIVEVDQESHTVVVRYTSDTSKKSIDEYPAVAFQVTNYTVTNLDEFIEAIRPQISLYVWQRDQAESPRAPVDLTGWQDQTIKVDAYELPVPAASTVPALDNPEVIV
jgi:hypothetical protein